MGAHVISAVKSGATILAASRGAINPNISMFMDGPPGTPYNRIAAVNRHGPMATVGFRDVGAALALCGVTGLQIDATPLEIWTTAAVDGAKFGTTGEKFNVTKGIMVPKGLTMQDGALAEIIYEIWMGSSAGAAPYTVTSAGTVPTAAFAALWTQGAITLNSVDIGPIQSTSIDFGLAVRQLFGDGKEWPLLVYNPKIQPIMTFETLNTTAVASVTLAGTANAVSITCQKLANGAARAGSGHKVFTAAQQLVTVESLSGDDGTDAVTRVTVAPSSDDGANTPIAVA